MSQTSHQPPAGWYPDPAGSGDERYWDGGTWSQVTRPTGGLHGSAQPQQAQWQQGHAQQPYGYGYAPGAAGTHGPARLAGWWWRVLASIVDSLVLLIPFAMVQSFLLGDAMVTLEQWSYDVLAEAERGSTTLPAFPQGLLSDYFGYLLVVMALTAAYRVVLVATAGGTVGQLACGLRVVREGDHSLGRIGWGTSAVRGILAVILFQVPVLGLVNALMPLFNRNRQTLHDLAAKTVVVKK